MKISQGITVTLSAGKISVSGPGGSLERSFNPRVVKVKLEGDELSVEPIGKPTRRTQAAVYSVVAHVRNMEHGVSKGFSKKLSVVYAHFPISLEVKPGHVLIKNFLGEKSPRMAKILPGVTVKADKQEISVTGADRDSVGQTAANIVQATRIRKRDVRVFQDGVYVAE